VFDKPPFEALGIFLGEAWKALTLLLAHFLLSAELSSELGSSPMFRFFATRPSLPTDQLPAAPLLPLPAPLQRRLLELSRCADWVQPTAAESATNRQRCVERVNQTTRAFRAEWAERQRRDDERPWWDVFSWPRRRAETAAWAQSWIDRIRLVEDELGEIRERQERLIRLHEELQRTLLPELQRLLEDMSTVLRGRAEEEANSDSDLSHVSRPPLTAREVSALPAFS
jgi:hypothetical protein